MAGLLPYYCALVAAILFGVVGQVLLKTGAVRSADVLAQFLDPFTIVGLGAYGLAAICYIAAIKKIPLTLAFPSVSLSYVLVAVIAHYAWNEPLGWPQLGGIALIAGGILLLHQA
jgi:undecaprenyl phosphate-alpha-L-ara4N flippase subunit ArnE